MTRFEIAAEPGSGAGRLAIVAPANHTTVPACSVDVDFDIGDWGVNGSLARILVVSAVSYESGEVLQQLRVVLERDQ